MAALDRATAYRKHLLAAGYRRFQSTAKHHLSRAGQTSRRPTCSSTDGQTSMSTRPTPALSPHRTPAIDIDVLDPGVADELQELAERMIGKSAVRTGRAPKRAMLFRADTPLSKISTPLFVSPDGRTHKVEILGWGQQIVVHGIAPGHTRTLYVAWWGTRPRP